MFHSLACLCELDDEVRMKQYLITLHSEFKSFRSLTEKICRL